MTSGKRSMIQEHFGGGEITAMGSEEEEDAGEERVGLISLRYS
jgi:hypothetical protein